MGNDICCGVDDVKHDNSRVALPRNPRVKGIKNRSDYHIYKPSSGSNLVLETAASTTFSNINESIHD
jgi:hypothetical protein